MDLNLNTRVYNTQELSEKKAIGLYARLENALDASKLEKGPSPVRSFMADPAGNDYRLSKNAQDIVDKNNKYDNILSKIKDKNTFLNRISKELSVKNPREAIKEFETLEKSKYYEIASKKKGTEEKKSVVKAKQNYQRAKKEMKEEGMKKEPTTLRGKVENSPVFADAKKKLEAKEKIDEAKKNDYPKESKKVKVKTSSEEKVAKGIKIGGYAAIGVIALATMLDVKHDADNRQQVAKETHRQEKKLKKKEAQERRDNGQSFGSQLQGHITNAPIEMGQMVMDMYNERIGHYKMGAAKNEIVGGAPNLNY